VHAYTQTHAQRFLETSAARGAPHSYKLARAHTHAHSYPCAQVFGDISSTCSALFGPSRANATATSLQTLSQTSHVMTVTAPSLEAQGRIPIFLTCRAGDVIDGYVQYQAPPSVSAVSTEGLCEALKQCSFLVTITNPPDNVKIPDNVEVSISGGKFASDTGIRATFVAVSTAELIMLIQTPVALTACNLTCEYLYPGHTHLYPGHRYIFLPGCRPHKTCVI
jgi:hypothetical protein